MNEKETFVSKEETNRLYSLSKAVLFLDLLDKAMASDLCGPQQLVLNALDSLYELFVDIETDGGFKVSNNFYNGNEIDLFHEVTKEYWNSVIFDEDLRSGNNISFFDIEDSRKTFLVVLGSEVLTNVPNDVEEVRKHIKQRVANVFNGNNFFNVKFSLTFIGNNLFTAEAWETLDLADLI